MSNSVSNHLVIKRDKVVNLKNVVDSSGTIFYNVQSGTDVDIINYDLPFSKEIIILKLMQSVATKRLVSLLRVCVSGEMK